MSIFDQLLEQWRVTRGDLRFPAPPTGVLRFDDESIAAMRVQGIAHPDGHPLVTMPELAAKALEIAIAEIGHGDRLVNGTYTNNRGPDVARYCAPSPDGCSWCAAFAGWCYERAAVELGIPLPFKRSLGAKRLGANVAAFGRRFDDPSLARPGDLVVWNRIDKANPTATSFGHVGLIRRVAAVNGIILIVSVDGNCGPLVREVSRTMKELAFFASVAREPAALVA